MLLLCYITSFVSEPFIFFFVLYDCVTYDSDIYHVSIMLCDLCDNYL